MTWLKSASLKLVPSVLLAGLLWHFSCPLLGACGSSLVGQELTASDRDHAPTSVSAPQATWNGTRPEYLVPVTDPQTGNRIIRITDAGKPISNPNNEKSLIGKSWAFETGHGYSSRVAWNADQSLIMMENGVERETILDGRTYTPLFSMDIPGDVRWHPTDPDVIYYIANQCIGALSVETRKEIWRKCWSEYKSLLTTSPGKGMTSNDGRIIPILAQRKNDDHWVGFYFFTDTQEASRILDLASYVVKGRPDYFMSPKGDVIIVYACIEGHEHPDCEAQVALDFETGLELWRDPSYHHPGHADDVIDSDGEQWRVGVSKEDGPLAGKIIKRNYRTGEIAVLIPQWGDHTSTRNIFDASKRIFVTYGSQNAAYPKQIVATCLERPCPTGVELIVDTHSLEYGRYLAEPQGSISPFGDRIVFRSNVGAADGPVDAYVVELSSKQE